MRKPMTEDMLALDIRKAKRFNDAAFLVTILFTIALIIFLLRVNQYTTFSSRRWKEDPARRSYMLNSLLTKHKLYNMEKENLIDLLGYDQHKWHSDNKNCLTYYIGKSVPSNSDRWLIIELDANRVTSFKICSE